MSAVEKLLPTTLKQFIVAEFVRNELGGKVTIIGAYAGGHILLSPSTTFPANFPLAFYGVFEDGVGEFDVKLQILSPDDEVQVDGIIGKAIKKPDQALTLAFSIAPFRPNSFGEYRFKIMLDDKAFFEKFYVKAQT